MSDIYKYAARKKFRFTTVRNAITAEQLFELPLTSASGFDLNTVAQTIDKELSSSSQKSFIEDNTSNPKKRDLEIALDIVKDVIKTKLEENKAQLERANKRIQRQKILDAMNVKKEGMLAAAPLEELQKQLDALDD